MLTTLLRRIFTSTTRRATGERLVASDHGEVRSFPDAAALRAAALHALADSDFDRAHTHFIQALAADPADVDSLIGLATAHAQQGEMPEARALLEKALELSPEHPAAHDILGNVLREQGRLAEAIESYERALAAEPRRASALSNQALCLRDLGRFNAAIEQLKHAVELNPSDVTVRSNLAALLFDVGDFDPAMAHVDTILREQPNHAPTRMTRALALLRHGDFANGWPDYEWRDHDVASAAYPYTVWDGTRLDDQSTLLVCAEQGLGDQIMFASCIPDLLALAPRCVIECDPRLVRLFARSFPAAHVYAHRKKATQPWLADRIVPSAKTWIGSLPLRFRSTPGDFSGRGGPYLTADSAKTATWKERLDALGPGLKIGVSWRGGVPTTRRALRSVDLAQWHYLLQLPGIHWISLQYGECRDELAKAEQLTGAHIAHWEDAIADYDETAALVCALDLVISVQTAVVHLAGALGKHVWVLVPRMAEWRYGESARTMPWYPLVRLFRQTSSEGWDDVVSEIGQQVCSLCGEERLAGPKGQRRK